MEAHQRPIVPDRIASHQCAVQNELVVPGLWVVNVRRKVPAERSRAVSDQFVILLGMIFQFIQVFDVDEEHTPCYFRMYIDAVHVHLFIFTVVGK